MMMENKKLLKASLKYIREGKTKYSNSDIIAFRIKMRDTKEKRRSSFKIAVGGVLCAYGVLTLWCPFSASIGALGLGCSLMINGGFDIWGKYKDFRHKENPLLWRIGLK